VAYEVDLWKRLENRRDAADTLAHASREDVDALAMTLASQVAEVWFAIAEQKAQIDLLGEQERIGRTFLELLELRFSLGQATALDVYQQRQQLAATRAQFPLAESLLEVLRNQLAVLMGLAPGSLEDEPRGLLPELPGLPDMGLPAELLQRRPDVRGAHLRILAADHGVGEAVADLLPALRLSAEVGFQGRAVEETFSNMIYQLVAGLAGPVYDRGRRQAEVERRKEVLEERLQGYRQKVLEALQEVEDALVREDRQGAYLLEVAKQIDLSRATLKQAGFRYSNGQSDYLPVLTALQGLQHLERREISSRRQLISHRIQLYRALGGAWTENLRPPDVQSKVISNGERP
jgi:NodT family efflux transporter outer membrane factor (OMF) lipoprotein